MPTPIPLRNSTRRQQRRGTTLVESAIVLSASAVLLLGMMEMSVVLVRYITVSEATRRVARAAIVHGSMTTATQGVWGPTTVNTNAGASNPAAVVAREALMALNPEDVTVQVRWPDGSNQPGRRVEVNLSYTHTPIVSLPAMYSTLELKGSSTMRVAH